MTRAIVRLGSKGLVLAPGELSRAEGALTTAQNVNIDAPGVIRSRTGYEKQTNAYGGPNYKFISTKQLGDNLLANIGTQNTANHLRLGNGTSTPSAILDSSGGTATVNNLATNRMQCIVSQKNHYLTSTTGVRRLESNNVLFHAGMPKSIGFDQTGPTNILVGSSGGFLPDQYACAYRQTWCKKDQEGVVMEGSPSSRMVVYNLTGTTGYSSGNAQNVTVRILLPKENGTTSTALTTSYFYRLYRSRIETTAAQTKQKRDPETDLLYSVSLVIPPSDEMSIVGEAYITNTDISNGYVDITDSTTEAYRAASEEQGPLYTNTKLNGGELGPQQADGSFLAGVALQNDPPPWAADCALFADCAWYGNIASRDHLEITLLSVTASSGLSVGDTWTMHPASPYSDLTLTAVASSPSNGQFVVHTTGATTSENIERTAQNIVECINKHTTNNWCYATYTPRPGFFGVIKIESRIYGGTITFSIAASAHGSAYRPQLGSGAASKVDTYTNGVMFSKPILADAVPPINLLFVGRQDTEILKMVTLRNSLYVFTTSGLYKIDGRDQDSFSIAEFDLNFKLLGRELSATCDDAIYAWGVGGIAKINSSGVEYITNPIEPLLWNIINTSTVTQIGTYGWAAAYQARHKVVFAYPTTSALKNCASALVYDTRMQAWTTWAFTAGRDADSTTGYSTGVARATDDLMFFGQYQASGNDTKVFKERRTYAAADYKDDTYDDTNLAIDKILVWAAANESPVLESHWDELHILYDVSPTFSAWTTPTTLTCTFTADFANAGTAQTITPTATSRMSRQQVTRGQRRSNRLTVTLRHLTASEYFGLEGLGLVHNPGEGTATVRN